MFSSDNENFILFGKVGLANLKAQEFFYSGISKCTSSGWESNGHKCSQLNWEGKGVTLFSRCREDRQRLELKGQRHVGLNGHGHGHMAA